MSTVTKQSAIQAFLAHIEAEWTEVKAEGAKLFAAIPAIDSAVDKLAPLAEVGLTITGNGAAATAVGAVKTIADTADKAVTEGVTTQSAPGLISTVEAAIKKL